MEVSQHKPTAAPPSSKSRRRWEGDANDLGKIAKKGLTNLEISRILRMTKSDAIKAKADAEKEQYEPGPP